MKIRICAEPGCVTNLSRFNPLERCWNHQDGQELTGAVRARVWPRVASREPGGHEWPTGAPVPTLQAVVPDRGACSPAFLDGIPRTYALTVDERTTYSTGAWLVAGPTEGRI